MTPLPDPDLVSMRCHGTKPGADYAWHSHPFDEITLVTEDTTTIRYSPGEIRVQPNTLLLYHRGERHGAWNTVQQMPRYWVIHFTAGPSLYKVFDRLGDASSRQRVWQLTSDQAETFRWFFLQILNEQTQQRTHYLLTQSSWLKLLFASVQRWACGENSSSITREMVNPNLLRLWHLINTSANDPVEALRQIRLMPNYDSLRHGFKKTFGCSPREMMFRLRMQHAKNLLLETGLSVKEIAMRSGYGRQHEFARAFHQYVGVSPTSWRRDPIQADDSKPAQLNGGHIRTS